jgi:hypothetical protein
MASIDSAVAVRRVEELRANQPPGQPRHCRPSGVSVRMRSQRCATCCEWVTIRALACCLAHAFEQQGEHLVGGARVEVAGRLVGQDQRRPVHQRARDRHALQFAARQRARPARTEAGEADARQQGLDAWRMLAGGDAGEQQRHRDVLRHGQRRQDMEGLEHEADAPGAQRGARRFVEALTMSTRLGPTRMAPASAVLQPGDAVEQRALADPGFADQGDDLAGRDGEAEPAEHGTRGPGRLQPAPAACRAAARIGLGFFFFRGGSSRMHFFNSLPVLPLQASLAFCAASHLAGLSDRLQSTGGMLASRQAAFSLPRASLQVFRAAWRASQRAGSRARAQSSATGWAKAGSQGRAAAASIDSCFARFMLAGLPKRLAA